VSLESALEIGFGAACLVVYAAGGAMLARAGVAGRSLLKRARALVPPVRVRERLHTARGDAQRALGAVPRLLPVLRRGRLAAASVAGSLAACTMQLRHMRAALGQVVFWRLPGPNGRSRP
jgi:hypothetical protein